MNLNVKNNEPGIFSTTKEVVTNTLTTAKETTELVAITAETLRKTVNLANNLMDELIVIQRLEAVGNIAEIGKISKEEAAEMLLIQKSN